jgi:hypothetical protein
MALKLPLRKILTEPGIPRERSVVVYKDRDGVYAKDENGSIICQNSQTSCLQEAVNRLVQFGGGRILVKRGTYIINQIVSIPDGMSLMIEGEGNNTVFRHTAQYNLFRHSSTTPTWTSVLYFRSFKVDRSGSGSNKPDIIVANYAKAVMFKNIEIIDDYSEEGSDGALVGYNNLHVIVEKCRIYNKNYGIWTFGRLSVIRDNYVENTAHVGIGGAGLVPNLAMPPGYSPGGITVIEDNLCIDCGRADEAVSVDYLWGNWVSNSFGVIRNNKIITTGGKTTKNAITAIGVENAVIENNEVRGNISKRIILQEFSKRVVIRSNVFEVKTAQPTEAQSNLIQARNEVIIEGNKITVDASEVGNQTYPRHIYIAGDAVLKNNQILIKANEYTFPSDARWIEIRGGKVLLEGNIIDIEYLVPRILYNAVSIFGNLIATKNRFNIKMPSDFYIMTPLSVAFSERNPYTIIAENVFEGQFRYGIILMPTLNDDIHAIKIRGNMFRAATADGRVFQIYISNKEPTVYLEYVGNTVVPPTTPIATFYFGQNLSPQYIIDWDVPVISDFGTVRYKFAKRNSGVATVPAGSTSVTVQHRLVCRPGKVIITPLAQPPDGIWVSDITEDTFTIRVSQAPQSNMPVAWMAEC